MEFRHISTLYEAEEWSRPDEMSMFYELWRKSRALLNEMESAKVLDLCCGTGMSLLGVISHVNISTIVGVDISEPIIQFAKKRYEQYQYASFIQDDAIDADLAEGSWEIILLCSAYHHIEDDRKVSFLKKVKKLLKKNGFAIMAENILPSYDLNDSSSYAEAVIRFYNAVLKDVEQQSKIIPKLLRDMIIENVTLGVRKEYEYKVSFPILESHLREADLKIVDCVKTWSLKEAPEDQGGNYVLTLR